MTEVAYETTWHGAIWRSVQPDAEVMAARARAARERSLRVELHRVDAAVDDVWRALPAICDRAQMAPEVVREAVRRRVESGAIERMKQAHLGIQSGTAWLYRRRVQA